MKMPKHRFLGAALALVAAVAVVAWLAWVRSTSQGAPTPVPEQATIWLEQAANTSLKVRHVIRLRNPSPGQRARGEIRLTLPSPVGLEAYLDGLRVDAQVAAAAGQGHVAVPVSFREEKVLLEIAYLVPPEHRILSWQIPWPLSRLDVMIPQGAGLSLHAVRLDGRPLQATAPGKYTAESVPAGAGLEVELGPAAEGSRAPGLPQLVDAWHTAIGFRVSRSSEEAIGLEHVGGALQSHCPRLDGAAAKEDGWILVLAASGSPERRSTDEGRASFRSYVAILFARTNPA